MAIIITSPDEITPQWLSKALHQAGALASGQVESLEKVVSHPHGDVPLSTIICRVTPRYSSEAPASAPKKLLVKIASPALMIGIPGLGKREVYFYNMIADYMGQLPVVRCYEAVYSDEQDRLHLLMDDLSETHLALPPMQMPPLASHCEMIIDALAQLHAYWWDHSWLQTKIGGFIDQQGIDDFIRAATQQYARCAGFLGDRLSAHRRSLYECALSGLSGLMSRRFLDHKNMTIVFEDVHAGNFLYPHDPTQYTLKIIDWEQWHINIGPHDLAYMMGVFWFPERRARLEQSLLHRYYDGLVAHGVQGYSWDDCWSDYRLSIARQLFVPVWQWGRERPPDIWWNHLERITSAFDDLHCVELFD